MADVYGRFSTLIVLKNLIHHIDLMLKYLMGSVITANTHCVEAVCIKMSNIINIHP